MIVRKHSLAILLTGAVLCFGCGGDMAPDTESPQQVAEDTEVGNASGSIPEQDLGAAEQGLSAPSCISWSWKALGGMRVHVHSACVGTYNLKIVINNGWDSGCHTMRPGTDWYWTGYGTSVSNVIRC
jgi:hypothetical protein